MNIEKLNQDLVQLVEKKNELHKLDYNDKNYDHIEERLHELEDKFIEDYGDYLEEVLMDVHDEFCPDNDVLSPIAYLANFYTKKGEAYEVAPNEGVLVDADDFPGKPSRLVLLPNPTRLILQVDSVQREEVWKAE